MKNKIRENKEDNKRENRKTAGGVTEILTTKALNGEFFTGEKINFVDRNCRGNRECRQERKQNHTLDR